MKTKTYRQDGKKWELPEVISLSHSLLRGPEYFFYDVEYRCPKKDEWFLSGAIIEAYKTYHDLSDKHLVISNLKLAKKIEVWIEQ